MTLLWDYNLDIPLATNKPSADQPKMKLNTNNIDNLLAVDHFGFNINNGGTHQQCQLFNVPGGNGTKPAGLQGADFGTLYSSLKASKVELWYIREADMTGIQLTGPGTPVASGNGASFLPGGLIINWGIYNAPGGNFSSGSTTNSSSGQSKVTLTNPFPNNLFFAVGSLLFTSSNLPSAAGSLNFKKSEISAGAISSLSWQVFANTNNYLGFVWMAIGN